MPIKIKSSGGGSVSFDVPNTGLDYTLTAPAKTGNIITSADANTITQAMIQTGFAGNGPAFSAYNNATQSITGGTNTKLAFQVKEFDTASCFDNTTNYRFTPNVAGYYMVTAAAELATVGNGYYLLKLYKNGSLAKYGSNFASSAGAYPCSNLAALVYLNGSTDYIEMYAAAAGNSTVNYGGVGVTYFQAYLVRSA